ncbi:hypothetical protein [Streptomyces sp. S1D4-20]|uniref:hypothetical protein n=1 Tax=Streptomyces sp. S1D4-20 TaxID=2594462 RepID=UPI0011658AEC|nr:hypothetical protein [Streptomyces sp. S1D4-20]QDN54088.1 hypothetical protein FNV67_00470 [Streptomyces sp. S1D4-20]
MTNTADDARWAAVSAARETLLRAHVALVRSAFPGLLYRRDRPVYEEETYVLLRYAGASAPDATNADHHDGVTFRVYTHAGDFRVDVNADCLPTTPRFLAQLTAHHPFKIKTPKPMVIEAPTPGEYKAAKGRGRLHVHSDATASLTYRRIAIQDAAWLARQLHSHYVKMERGGRANSRDTIADAVAAIASKAADILGDGWNTTTADWDARAVLHGANGTFTLTVANVLSPTLILEHPLRIRPLGPFSTVSPDKDAELVATHIRDLLGSPSN